MEIDSLFIHKGHLPPPNPLRPPFSSYHIRRFIKPQVFASGSCCCSASSYLWRTAGQGTDEQGKNAKLNKQSKDVLVQCVRFSAPAPLIEPSIELIPLTMSSKWYPIAMNGPRNMFTPTKTKGGSCVVLGEEWERRKYVIIVHSALTFKSIQCDDSSGNPIWAQTQVALQMNKWMLLP